MKSQKEYEEHLKMRAELWADYDNQATLSNSEGLDKGEIQIFIEEDLDRNNKESVLRYLQNNEFKEYEVQDLYSLVSHELRCDVDIARHCISLDGICIEDAPEEIQSNREMVILAAKTNGWALSVAPDNLKDDEQVVLECVKEKKNNFMHASERIQEMCKGYDPVKYLESALMVKDFNASLSNKTSTKSKKLKI